MSLRSKHIVGDSPRAAAFTFYSAAGFLEKHLSLTCNFVKSLVSKAPAELSEHLSVVAANSRPLEIFSFYIVDILGGQTGGKKVRLPSLPCLFRVLNTSK